MSIRIEDELHTDFMVYATCVNEERAFPDVRDGLKPSQRACLWAMFSHNYSSNKPHVKCAKVDGLVTGELHPHGSEYGTLVNMSQAWTNNIPEVDFHGANGSSIGGPEAAASRYTECRLSKVAEEGMLCNVKNDVVDMIPNYSEDLYWPSVLPALFPRLFVNGSQGIGYTIAQEWEPGNLTELVKKVKEYIKTGKVNCNDIYPDYPTGGIIINKNDIHTIYETGKGSVILRGKTEIVGDIIKITELPFQVYAEDLIQKIKDLVNDNQLTGIEDIYNKSSDAGLLIEIECSENPEDVLAKLFKLTDLQCTYSANQMALVNHKPVMLTLEAYIKNYLAHNIECLVREYKYNLKSANERLEIVEGLLIALNNIDKVISVIKTSDTPKTELIGQFGLTENQAKAILDMKLAKLSKLETKALTDEEAQLKKTVEELQVVIGSKDEQTKIFLSRLDAFTKKYGWERRTRVTSVDLVKERKEKKKKTKNQEQYVIALTENNYIKRIKATEYKANAKLYGDAITKTIVLSKNGKAILISESGKLLRLPVKEITIGSTTSTGTSLTDLFSEKIIGLLSGQEAEQYLVMVDNEGKLKKMALEDVAKIKKTTEIMKTGISYLGLYKDGDKLTFNFGGKDKVVSLDDFDCRGKSAGPVKAVKSKLQFMGVK